MSNASVYRFVLALENLSPADRATLRSLAGRTLDRHVEGFDIFTGFYWPLRDKNQFAPRRSVAWLVTKLYAAEPLPHETGRLFARQLGAAARGSDRVRREFDLLLSLPLGEVEPNLRSALSHVRKNERAVDWAQLVDDLSAWKQRDTRQLWAEQFLESF